jgi:SAM-dependent methyltransferase
VTATTRWGARAAELYGDAYARRSRGHDDAIRDGELMTRFGGWLRGICDRVGRDIDVLDLGCGTGRYFHSLRHVRRLVGIDVARPMLDRARHPVGAPAIPVEFIEGDFLAHDFGVGQFDLVYAIGALAEHSPFDEAVAARVRRWLKPGGRFAFTVVHPLSFSVPRILKRRLAEALLPISGGALRRGWACG